VAAASAAGAPALLAAAAQLGGLAVAALLAVLLHLAQPRRPLAVPPLLAMPPLPLAAASRPNQVMTSQGLTSWFGMRALCTRELSASVNAATGRATADHSEVRSRQRKIRRNNDQFAAYIPCQLRRRGCRQHLSDRLCKLRLRPASSSLSSTWSMSIAAGPADSAAGSAAAACTSGQQRRERRSTEHTGRRVQRARRQCQRRTRAPAGQCKVASCSITCTCYSTRARSIQQGDSICLHEGSRGCKRKTET